MNLLITFLLLISLSSCVGGEGGEGSGSSSIAVTYRKPSWVSSISNTQADFYRTTEYSINMVWKKFALVKPMLCWL
jgi:hypothetical protein